MFVVENGTLTVSLGEIHNYETRRKNKYLLQKPKLNVYKKGPIYAGSKFYNTLPENLQGKDDKSFKFKLKKCLLDKCYYSINEFLTSRLLNNKFE